MDHDEKIIVKNSRENVSDEMIIEKVLCTLTSEFYHTVVAIEQSKDTADMEVEELQGNLEARELKLKEKGAKI